jgi:hypothetical protein
MGLRIWWALTSIVNPERMTRVVWHHSPSRVIVFGPNGRTIFAGSRREVLSMAGEGRKPDA